MKLPNKTNLAIIVFIVAAIAAIALASNQDSTANDASNQTAQSEQQKEEAKAEDKRGDKPAAEVKEESKEESKEEKPAEQAEEKSDEKSEDNKSDEQSSNSYEYTAQPGDSYSLIARKAIQTYGIINNVNLSEAQILFAETNLTLAADSPQINQGQSINLDESTIKHWVEKAGELSESAKNAWQAYTAGVNFNTDNVGESR